jgi:hypothetical protein
LKIKMREVVCDDDKTCTLEEMPKIGSQTGSGMGGLSPEGSSYLIPMKSATITFKKPRVRALPKRQRDEGRKKTPQNGGKKRRPAKKSTIHSRAIQLGGRKKRPLTKKKKCPAQPKKGRGKGKPRKY